MHVCGCCGKTYKRLKPFQRHRAVCEMLSVSKKSKEDVTHLTEDLPSELDMWMALQTALKKIDRLEKKVESQQRWISRQKKKLSIIDWLNNNYKSNTSFVEWYNSFTMTQKDLELIFNHDFIVGMGYIIQKNLPLKNLDLFPIRSFEQKLNVLFVYNGKSWEMLDMDEFTKMIDVLHKKIHSVFVEWNNIKKRSLNFETIDENYYKNIGKVMGGKFSKDVTIKKINFKLYNYLKFNLRNIVQYDFTF